MAKKRKSSKQDVMEYLRLGGEKLRPGLAGKATAATEAMRKRELTSSKAVRSEGTRLFCELTGASSVHVDDPANKKALEGLLGWHNKITAKSLPFPKVQRPVGGFFPGHISGTVVAPFDFADTIPTVIAGATVLSASANLNGQISANASTSDAGFNGGSEYARVGFYFHPTSEGRLTVSASLKYSYEWVTNSLNTSPVISEGNLGIGIYGFDEHGQILATSGSDPVSWYETTPGGLQLDFGADIPLSISTSLQADHSLVYLCFVAIDSHVNAQGWPGSLAVAMLSATVASMSFDFAPLIVAQP